MIEKSNIDNLIVVGDIHGDFEWLNTVATNNPGHLFVQVGDFGIFNERDLAKVEELPDNIRFIRGNHDNPELVKRSSKYISDGLIVNDVMFIGGANSIDKEFRTPGYSWWPEEELSERDLDVLFETYNAVRPRVMITHTIPEKFALDVLLNTSGNRYPSRTEAAFDRFYEVHRPELWIYGHWHEKAQKLIKDGTFFCGLDCNELYLFSDKEVPVKNIFGPQKNQF